MFNSVPVGFADGKCAEVPEDSPLYPRLSELTPYALFGINGLAWCLLGCNKTAVALTGNDPCRPGSLTSPAASRSDMACYDVGANMS
jgi:hypothetical protein